MLPEKRLLSRRKFLSFLPIVPMAVIPTQDAQKPNAYNPQFKIGDYVEYRVLLEEEPNWYERGDVIQREFDEAIALLNAHRTQSGHDNFVEIT